MTFLPNLYYLSMQKGSPKNNNYTRWEHLDTAPVSGSLILNTKSSSPKSFTPGGKLRLDDYGFKQGNFVRHDSQKQFNKPDPFRNGSHLLPGDYSPRAEEDSKAKPSVLANDRIRNSDIYANRPSNSGSKTPEMKGKFFMARKSGGKANALKETSSTSNSNEALVTHKSQKTFPSFLRGQGKAATKKMSPGVSKQNFKFIKKLGEGKFGSVYLARQLNTGFMVGLKVVQKRRIIKDNFMTQFIRQLKIQKFLQHPNIIKIYGLFADEDNVYIILELGSEGQLYDVISCGTTLSEETTSFIIGNLLDAVSLMHKHRILHRDIKPQNIVLVHGNIKLCDFGWAVNKKEELRSTFCGTPLYLSPELIQGSRYDEKVDIWAVGILAYEMHYGVSPFDIQQHEDLPKIVTNEVQFPLGKEPSKQFREFLVEILKKNPKERMDCKNLLSLQFIKKYRQLQTCEQLCH